MQEVDTTGSFELEMCDFSEVTVDLTPLVYVLCSELIGVACEKSAPRLVSL